MLKDTQGLNTGGSNNRGDQGGMDSEFRVSRGSEKTGGAQSSSGWGGVKRKYKRRKRQDGNNKVDQRYQKKDQRWRTEQDLTLYCFVRVEGISKWMGKLIDLVMQKWIQLADSKRETDEKTSRISCSCFLGLTFAPPTDCTTIAYEHEARSRVWCVWVFRPVCIWVPV